MKPTKRLKYIVPLLVLFVDYIYSGVNNYWAEQSMSWLVWWTSMFHNRAFGGACSHMLAMGHWPVLAKFHCCYWCTRNIIFLMKFLEQLIKYQPKSLNFGIDYQWYAKILTSILSSRVNWVEQQGISHIGIQTITNYSNRKISEAAFDVILRNFSLKAYQTFIRSLKQR